MIQKLALIPYAKARTGIRPGCFSSIQKLMQEPNKKNKNKKNDKFLKKIIRQNRSTDLNTWPLFP